MIRRTGAALAALCMLLSSGPVFAQGAPEPAAPFQAEPVFQPRIERVKVGEIEMGYYARGNGAPLVMIMGLGATMADWDPALLEALSHDRTLIVIDNRGCGFSSDTAQNHTSIAQMADDAAGLVTALGYDKVDVLGYSMGAMIASQMAIRHPEILRSLVLLAPSPGGSHEVPPPTGVLEAIAHHTLALPQVLALFFPEDPAGQEAGRALVLRAVAGRKAGTIPAAPACSEETGTRQLEALRQFSASDANYDALPAIAAPTLVMGGRADKVLPPANAQAVAQRIPFAWSAYFEGGHLFWAQSRAPVIATLRAFLQ
ncbi:alpha/beta fold hydrolase [Roseixanthobacter glucoisosaccharinicivorans]|uniref:alpha/beta fold hydrolase n=1 Tax=Roseixanthobacter glucoisosaccharinicivorans TaxID=3119923 RepID=UPI00372C19FF